MQEIIIITDGACSGNPGPGGWAALLKYKDHEKMLTGRDPMTTNNRMELQAVIEGLKAVKKKCHVKIISDSKYIVDAFKQGWYDNWQNNGWKTANNKPVKNEDLWQELGSLLEKHHVDWEWVKGHSGHVDNDRVDEAARGQIQK